MVGACPWGGVAAVKWVVCAFHAVTCDVKARQLHTSHMLALLCLFSLWLSIELGALVQWQGSLRHPRGARLVFGGVGSCAVE